MHYRCIKCEAYYDFDETLERCGKCSAPILVEFDQESLRAVKQEIMHDSHDRKFWRYAEFSPIKNGSMAVTLGEGETHLHKAQRLSSETGVGTLLLKDETTNPTGSFIDRGSAVLVSRAKELSANTLVCATTGNVGASIAAYGAKAGLHCRLFTTRNVDVGKLYQMLAFGAIVDVCSDYEKAVQVASKTDGAGHFRVTPTNPFLLHGLKTCVYEICEQLGWRAPEYIAVPMGNGGFISMVWRALLDLQEVGLLSKVPTRLIGVQTSSRAPIVAGFRKILYSDTRSSSRGSLAFDIAVRKPLMAHAAIQAIRASRGNAVDVSDTEILDATMKLARQEGIFAEPAAASTIAALTKLIRYGHLDRDSEVVCVITGAGLKDVSTAGRLVQGNIGNTLMSLIQPTHIVSKIGDTKIRILKILQARESYGYEIWGALAREMGRSIKIPTIYQHLSEMEKSGLIRETRKVRVRGKPGRRYFATTSAGERLIQTL